MRTRQNLRIWQRSKLKKKAQEEIVGFVVIVLLVAVALVIVLGITIRQDHASQELESRDIYQFLESTMQYTSDCAISYEPNFLTLGELLRECSEGLSTCVSGEEPCKTAELAIKDIIESSFNVSEEASTKGYEFLSKYTLEATEEEIILISKGNCTNSIKGAEYLAPAFPGTISSTLKLCY